MILLVLLLVASVETQETRFLRFPGPTPLYLTEAANPVYGLPSSQTGPLYIKRSNQRSGFSEGNEGFAGQFNTGNRQGQEFLNGNGASGVSSDFDPNTNGLREENSLIQREELQQIGSPEAVSNDGTRSGSLLQESRTGQINGPIENISNPSNSNKGITFSNNIDNSNIPTGRVSNGNRNTVPNQNRPIDTAVPLSNTGPIQNNFPTQNIPQGENSFDIQGDNPPAVGTNIPNSFIPPKNFQESNNNPNLHGDNFPGVNPNLGDDRSSQTSPEFQSAGPGLSSNSGQPQNIPNPLIGNQQTGTSLNLPSGGSPSNIGTLDFTSGNSNGGSIPNTGNLGNGVDFGGSQGSIGSGTNGQFQISGGSINSNGLGNLALGFGYNPSIFPFREPPAGLGTLPSFKAGLRADQERAIFPTGGNDLNIGFQGDQGAVNFFTGQESGIPTHNDFFSASQNQGFPSESSQNGLQINLSNTQGRESNGLQINQQNQGQGLQGQGLQDQGQGLQLNQPNIQGQGLQGPGQGLKLNQPNNQGQSQGFQINQPNFLGGQGFQVNQPYQQGTINQNDARTRTTHCVFSGEEEKDDFSLSDNEFGYPAAAIEESVKNSPVRAILLYMVDTANKASEYWGISFGFSIRGRYPYSTNFQSGNGQPARPSTGNISPPEPGATDLFAPGRPDKSPAFSSGQAGTLLGGTGGFNLSTLNTFDGPFANANLGELNNYRNVNNGVNLNRPHIGTINQELSNTGGRSPGLDFSLRGGETPTNLNGLTYNNNNNISKTSGGKSPKSPDLSGIQLGFSSGNNNQAIFDASSNQGFKNIPASDQGIVNINSNGVGRIFPSANRQANVNTAQTSGQSQIPSSSQFSFNYNVPTFGYGSGTNSGSVSSGNTGNTGGSNTGSAFNQGSGANNTPNTRKKRQATSDPYIPGADSLGSTNSVCKPSYNMLVQYIHYGGPCFMYQPQIQSVFFAQCSNAPCSGCRFEAGTSRCTVDRVPMWVYSYCEKGPNANQVAPDRILVPVSCSCKTSACNTATFHGR